MLRPTASTVKAKDNYLLEVTFDNGEIKTFDVKPYIKGSWSVSYTHLTLPTICSV